MSPGSSLELDTGHRNGIFKTLKLVRLARKLVIMDKPVQDHSVENSSDIIIIEMNRNLGIEVKIKRIPVYDSYMSK